MACHPPSWARELVQLLPACGHFLASGNIRDKYFIDHAGAGAADERSPRSMDALRFVPDLLESVLRARGTGAVVSYDISSGASVLPEGDDKQVETATRLLGQSPQKVARDGSLVGLADLVAMVMGCRSRVALIVQSASRLVRNLSQLDTDEFGFFRRVDQLARRGRPLDDGEAWFNPVIWLLDSERDVPDWFALGNVSLRSIVLPLPDTGDRERFAQRFLPTLARSERPLADLDQAVRVLRDQTAGMTLAGMQKVIDVARERGTAGPSLVAQVEDAVRYVRIGVADNPWRRPYLLRRIRAELAPAQPPEPARPADPRLADRVIGQARAVRKAVDILARSASGLTGAHASVSATRPRGVLFFAGPTGVGKTELAKALAELIFGHENRLVRFDMSEFSAEQSEARLIGSPPGYVGFNAGGELTNAIRRQAFSVVLFDEIEKAHPRILDKFLQILDDGRLTDGRGDTVMFTEAVVIFTTNLGVYRDVRELDAEGNLAGVHRVLNVAPDEGTYEERERTIRGAIRDHFELGLGRPELLNRIGEANIVVFDFIGPATGRLILDQMIARVGERVLLEHNLTLALAPSVRQAVDEDCLSAGALKFGGRGIGTHLETVLVNPLAEALVSDRPGGAQFARVSVLEAEGGIWTATMEYE
jgi:hypothetical protein